MMQVQKNSSRIYFYDKRNTCLTNNQEDLLIT